MRRNGPLTVYILDRERDKRKEMGALWVMVAWNGESLGDLGR